MGDYDPNDYNVDEVNDYLATADDDERARVLEAERNGKARVGILEGPSASQDAPGGEDGNQQTTAGQTFQEAAKAATPDEIGYLGTSPEAERTGKRDKGLSQRNPAVMNQAEPTESEDDEG